MPKFSQLDADANVPKDARLLYDMNEAAGLLYIDVCCMRHWIAKGIIRTVRKGRKVLIPRSEIVKLARKQVSESMRPFFGNKGAQITALLYCREDAAAMLAISLRALDYLLADERLKRFRMGRRVLVRGKEMERLSRTDQVGWLRPPRPREAEKSTESPTDLPRTKGDNAVDEEAANG
jgi:hypothetical protein